MTTLTSGTSSASGKKLLTMALESGDRCLAALAVKVLINASEPARTALEEILLGSSTSVLRLQRVADGLADSGEFETLEWLLQHRSSDVRLHVVRLLASHGTGFQALSRCSVLESDPYVASEMINSKEMLARRADNIPPIRRSAALSERDQLTIRLLCDDEVSWGDAPALVEIFQNSKPPLQDRAGTRLASLGRPGVLAIAAVIDQTDDRGLEATWKLLFKLDQAASLGRLRARLNRQVKLPWCAVDFLVQVASPEAAELIIAELALEAPDARYSTRLAIENVGAITLKPLSRAFRQDARIRKHEAVLLARIGGELVVEQLVNALLDADSPTERDVCERTLLSLGAAAANVLAALYSRSDHDTRIKLMRTLGKTHFQPAISLLHLEASEPGMLQAPAIVALGWDSTEESRKIVLAAVSAKQPEVRAAAAEALSQWDFDEALTPLLSLAVDASLEVAKKALGSLERLNVPSEDAARRFTLAVLEIANARSPATESPEFVGFIFDLLGKVGHTETLVEAAGGEWVDPRVRPNLETLIGERRRIERERVMREDLSAGSAHALHAPLSRISDSGSNAEPATISDAVHFSVTAPSVVSRGKEFLLDIWAHLEKLHDEVLHRAQRELGTDRVYLRSAGPSLVGRDTKLRVILSIPSLGFEDAGELYWNGRVSNTTFLVPISPEAQPGLQTGTVQFLIGPLRIARLHFSVLVGDYSTDAEDRTLFQDRVKTAFASYATEDRQLVLSRIQGMLKLVPTLDVFLDVVSLRSGEDWQRRIEDEITSRDVFYLFWSRFAKDSPWVEREWRIALERKGLECIDPVPLDSPVKAPPPIELASLHFNEWTLLR